VKKLWETAAAASLDPGLEAFLSSTATDVRLLPLDIAGSRAHAAMLGRQGIIAPSVAASLEEGLAALAAEAEEGSLKVDPTAEDVHSFVEAELTERMGDAGRSLHAGRSRNDQVALDLRLWLRAASLEVRKAIRSALGVILAKAEAHSALILPGYTHLQRAQAVTWGHHLLAWATALRRDLGRFSDAAARADECPLGACALAGSGLPLDREGVAASLGFSRVSPNTMDAVADRDACVEFAAAAATLLMHLSRYCEEVTLWASQEFAFVRLGPGASTGSSVMPQKRNPDPAELIRGKTGRAYASLVNLLVLQKGLPLAYDRDLQEDKAAVFDAADTALACLRAFATLVSALEPQEGAMRGAAESGCLWAADAAEFLVARSSPFRTAYAAARALVEAYLLACEGPGDRLLPISDFLSGLGTEGLSALHPDWVGVAPAELAPWLSLEACVERRQSTGGPGSVAVAKGLADLRAFLAGDGEGPGKVSP
jgi:argininosuccinate lyase